MQSGGCSVPCHVAQRSTALEIRKKRSLVYNNCLAEQWNTQRAFARHAGENKKENRGFSIYGIQEIEPACGCAGRFYVFVLQPR